MYAAVMLYSSSASFLTSDLEEWSARGVYVSWRKCVDSDVLNAQLAGHAAAHLEDGRFARAV